MYGAICGDILGSTYEFEKKKYQDPTAFPLCNEGDTFTDDTAMTLAVMEWLLKDLPKNYYNDDALKQALAERMADYACNKMKKENLGFGARFGEWCFRGYFTHEFPPINSYGNGAGMRVSPVGWYFDTMEETMRFAKLSADVSHDHPEGEKGAMCIAAAIFLARNGSTKEEIKDYLIRAFGYEDLNESSDTLREKCNWSEICQDTVPMSVVAFLDSSDYESAVRIAISYGSDSDTIGDMAGAIAEAYYREIPEKLLSFCQAKLYSQSKELCEKFYQRLKKK